MILADVHFRLIHFTDLQGIFPKHLRMVIKSFNTGRINAKGLTFFFREEMVAVFFHIFAEIQQLLVIGVEEQKIPPGMYQTGTEIFLVCVGNLFFQITHILFCFLQKKRIVPDHLSDKQAEKFADISCGEQFSLPQQLLESGDMAGIVHKNQQIFTEIKRERKGIFLKKLVIKVRAVFR